MVSCCCGFLTRSGQQRKTVSAKPAEQAPLLAKQLDKGACSEQACEEDKREQTTTVKLEPAKAAFLPDASKLESKSTIKPTTEVFLTESNDSSDSVAKISASTDNHADGSGLKEHGVAYAREQLPENTSTAASLVSSARIKAKHDDFNGAVVDFSNAISLLEKDARQSPSTAVYFVELGNALSRLDDTEGALSSFKEACTIREMTGTLDTQEGADLLENMGILQSELVDVDSAICSYIESRRIREAIGTLQSTDGASLLSKLGMAMSEIGDTDGALMAFAEARTIYEQMGNLQTSECAKLLLTMGVLQSQDGDLESACATLTDCWRIYQATGTTQEPDAVMCLQMLQNVGGVEDD